jgi:O-antigen ligase
MASASHTTAVDRRLAAAALVGMRVVVGAATVAGATSARPTMSLAPVALCVLAFVIARIPLHVAAAGFVALILIPDSNFDEVGDWRTPLAFVGDLVGHGFGLEAIALALIGVAMARSLPSPGAADEVRVPSASALGPFLALYVAGVVVADLIGVVNGLPPAPWKIRILLEPILLVVLFSAAFRGPADHELLGRVVVSAACARAALAVVVQRIAIAHTGGKYAYATSHGDSILFSVGLFLVLADLAVRPSRRRFLRNGALAAVILVGAIENDRRAFWAMVVVTLLAAFVLGPKDRWKRAVTRSLRVILPVAALYVGLGWGSGSAIFAPVRTFRGMLDTKASRSSYWREVENWNIAVSLRKAPVAGLGLGGEYTEEMPNDDISSFYPEYRQWPHNGVLGLLLLMGPLGLTSVTALLGLAFFLATRSLRLASTPELQVAAFGCHAAVIACLVLAWSDLGLGFPQYRVFAALAVTVSAKLAVATGAWPARTRSLA